MSLLFLFSFFFSTAFYLFFPFFLLFIFYFYISSSNFSFNQPMLFDYGIINDEFSLFIIYITVVVLYCSYLNVNSSFNMSFSLLLSFFLLFLFCYFVFSTSSVFYMYLYYEASLIPILYIIINYGVYPERSLSAIILLIYTAVFTFPFLVVLFTVWYSNGSFNFVLLHNCSSTLSFFFSLITFLAFAVKLPIYGLHYWLPIAHVEAPTYGSIILAGVLLNLGGVALYRLSFILNILYLNYFLLSYFMVILLLVTFICIFQSDFKRLIAYSSVSHIMAIPILMLSSNLLSDNALLTVILFHGLSSPILFSLVGLIYSFYGSRQLVVIRGLILISPMLTFITILAFFFTLSAPPFPSFMSEVYFILSSYFLSSYLAYFFVFFAFLSLVYNLNWLVPLVFTNAENLNNNFTLTFKVFLSLILSLLVAVLLLFMFMFM